MPRLRSSAIVALVILASTASAGSDDWRFLIGPALSFKVLGSEDARFGVFYGVQQSKPEPRFRVFGHDAELVREVYYMQTRGGGFRVWPVTYAHNYGVTFLGRYWSRSEGPFRVYFEAGWGVDYINRLTYDLYYRLNSSPQIGFGCVTETDDYDIQVGLRWKHLSNAGTTGNNEGENYLILHFGFKF